MIRTQFSLVHGCDITGSPVNVSQSFTGISLAVPEMSLSLRDLLDRHLRGGNVKTYNPVYRSDRFPEVEKMDKLQLFDLAKQTADFIANKQGKLVSARAAALRNQRKAELDAARSANIPDLAGVADKATPDKPDASR